MMILRILISIGSNFLSACAVNQAAKYWRGVDFTHFSLFSQILHTIMNPVGVYAIKNPQTLYLVVQLASDDWGS
jgi:hypothetical protein